MENKNNSLEGGVAAAAICSQKRATPDAHRAITRGANECWYRFVIRQKNEVEKLERDRDEARELLRDLVLAIGSHGDGASMMHPQISRALNAARDHLSANAERIHGGVRESKSEPASTPLDGASC